LKGLVTASGMDGDGLGVTTVVPLTDLSWRGLAAVCERSLWAGDASETARILSEALRRNVELGVVYEGIVTPALRRIGDLWDPTDRQTVDRPTATSTAVAAMQAIAAGGRLRSRRPARRVVFATDADEPHTVGLMMAAGVLEGAGHEAIRCDAATSLETVIELVRATEADGIAISCTTDRSGDRLDATTEILWRTLPGLPVLVGGRGVPARLPDGPIARVRSLDDLTDAVVAIGSCPG